MINIHTVPGSTTPNIDWGGTEIWKSMPDNQINALFEQIFTNEELASHRHTSLGIPQQFNRLRGYDFGEVVDPSGAEKGFRDYVKTIAENKDEDIKMSLSMALAVRRDPLGVEPDCFRLYFKTFDGNDINFWQKSESSDDHGMDYSTVAHPQRDSAMRYGISTELRNQLCYNWGVMPFSVVSDMFYALTSPKNPIYQNEKDDKTLKEEQIKLSKGWVRAHEYQIRGNNLQAFNSLLQEGNNNTTRIRTKFGINLSDVLLGSDIFTIIIEVENGTRSNPDLIEVDNTTYLEFVHACPPFCDP